MTKKLVLGNAAIAEGALESGVEVVTGYPGTPSSELVQYLAERVIDEKLSTHVEWSVNEKVAMDVAIAAAWGGKRALVTMKMAGLNVASDSLVNVAYKGVNGALVVYVTDDPGTHAGCTEQDSRYYSLLMRVPVLEASDPADAKRLVKLAFEASEKMKMPVLLRATTNVAHIMGVIECGSYQQREKAFEFTKDMHNYTTILANREAQHQRMFVKLEQFQEFLDSKNLNPVLLKGKLGVAASGVSWTYLAEAVSLFGLDVSLMKVDSENPWPARNIKKLLAHCDKVLVLEELDPIVENLILQTMAETGKIIQVMGKNDGTLSRTGEYSFEMVKDALSKLLGKKLVLSEDTGEGLESVKITKRNLTFCVGCQHRSTYFIIGKAIRKAGFKKEEVIITGDIGCTSLGVFKPLETLWTETTMGASIGLAHGFKAAGNEKPVIATLGDSTFFHAGLPPLVNAVQNGTDMTVIVLDNGWTAMTGFQPNPNTGINVLQQETARITVQQVVEALNIPVKIIEPYRMKESIDIVAETINQPGVNVIIAREECALQSMRKAGKKTAYRVDPEKCRYCLACVRTFACPAISDKDTHTEIDRVLCIGCGACADVCQFGAIDISSDNEEV